MWSFVLLPFELSHCNTRNILLCLSHAQNMEMVRDEYVLGFGFKSCDIPIYWWTWMLSFLLNQIWIRIDDFLLKFFATLRSVLGQQDTVLIRISQIHWHVLLCLVKCWALSLTSKTSLLHSLSCHQTYRIGWTFIDLSLFLTHHCFTLRILKNI